MKTLCDNYLELVPIPNIILKAHLYTDLIRSSEYTPIQQVCQLDRPTFQTLKIYNAAKLTCKKNVIREHSTL
jgi:hypothetical protein